MLSRAILAGLLALALVLSSSLASWAQAPSWGRTYGDGEHLYTLEASGSLLSGTQSWTPRGLDHATQGNDETFKCIVQGNVATCGDYSGQYRDNDKTINYAGTQTLTLTGSGLSVKIHLNSATPQWKHGDLHYESAVHPGAEFAFDVTRTSGGATSSAGACSDQEDAYQELRARALASQTSLELLREYRAALDDQYLAVAKAETASAVVDVASLAAGWPIGAAVEKAFLGEVKNTLTEKLIKGGLKSIEKRMLKDPTLAGVLDQALDPENASIDVLKEAHKNQLKEVFGEGVSGTVIGLVDIFKTGKRAYAGMKQEEAIRAMIRDADARILALEVQHTDEIDNLENANYARNECQDRAAKNLPPDNDNPFWRRVTDYLAKGSTGTWAPLGQLPPPNGLSCDATPPPSDPGAGILAIATCPTGWNGDLLAPPSLPACEQSGASDPPPNISVGPVDRGLLPPGYSLVNEPGGAPTLIRTPPDVHLRNTGAVTPERVQAARDKLSDDIDAKQNDLQNYCGQYANDWATRTSSDPPLPDTQKWPQRINDLAATIQAAKQLRADLDFRLGNTTE